MKTQGGSAPRGPPTTGSRAPRTFHRLAPLAFHRASRLPLGQARPRGATARAHPDGIVDLSVGTPVDPTPESYGTR